MKLLLISWEKYNTENEKLLMGLITDQTELKKRLKKKTKPRDETIESIHTKEKEKRPRKTNSTFSGPLDMLSGLSYV